MHSLKPGTLLVVALLSPLAGCKKSEPTLSTSQPSPSATASSGTAAAPQAPATSAAVPEGVKKFLGRWVRADGGYVLELRNPDISGKMEASYLNPKSINVSRAIWMQGGSGLQVAVELNDVGYPGATYVLSHDAQGDRLVGQYTQPQMQQTFDVEFIRQNAVPLR